MMSLFFRYRGRSRLWKSITFRREDARIVDQERLNCRSSIDSNYQSFLARRFIKDVGQMASSTVLSVVHGGHKNTSSTLYVTKG